MAYISKWKGQEIDNTIQEVVDKSELWDGKQDKITGRQGQVVGFDALGNATAQELSENTVSSFNGRTGAIEPATGDYTAAMVGAKDKDWMPTPADIGAMPADVVVPKKTSELENDSGYITADEIDISNLENVVKCEGGATIEIPTSIGGAPHVITITEDEGGSSSGGGVADNGLPEGGNTGQILAKKSNTDYDTEWVNIPPSSSDSTDLSLYATKDSPVFTGSISLGRKDGTTKGVNSFAVGNSVTADYPFSHAEGQNTTASGTAAHAEGSGSIASGGYSHAEGNSTTASGKNSHAGGSGTIAAGPSQTAIGEYNISSTSYSDRFIIGKGSFSARSNCFRVTDNGVYASGNYNASGADYAEMFEWLDGNKNNEDRRGRFVTLKSNKIKLANKNDDFILGIVSGAPSIVGGVYDDQWKDMYVRDIFGTPVCEEVNVPEESIKVPSGKNPKKMVKKVIYPAHKEIRMKLNPDYDSTQPYIARTERKEWSAVGMIGQLVAVDDGLCEIDGYCKPGDNGIAMWSHEKTKYRVMERLDENHIKVLIL